LAEAGLLPAGLPGLLRHLARLALADIPRLSRLLGTHRSSRFVSGSPHILPYTYPAVTHHRPTALCWFRKTGTPSRKPPQRSSAGPLGQGFYEPAQQPGEFGAVGGRPAGHGLAEDLPPEGMHLR